MDVTTSLEDFRFDEAANRLYHFVWGTFCDWYLEFTKPILQGEDIGTQAETRATAAWVLEQVCHLLHPIMPFVTEEVWRQLAGEDASFLITAAWPDLPPDLHDPETAAEMDWVVAAISAIRTTRNELNVPAGARLPLLVKDAEPEAMERLTRHREHFLGLARLETIAATDATPSGSVPAVVSGATLILPLGDIVDLGRERARLAKEIGRLEADLGKLAGKLTNPAFLSKAKPEVIDEQREREADIRRDRDRLKAAYERLEPV